MREDELDGIVKLQERIPVAENEIENLLVFKHGVFAVGILVAASLRKIIALNRGDFIGRGGDGGEFVAESRILFAKQGLDDAIVLDVVVHPVDENERKAFDAEWG